ncbi:MAG: alpha/beta fold hydrolase [Nitrospira sp.]
MDLAVHTDIDAATRERMYGKAAAGVAAVAAAGSMITTRAPHGQMTWRIWGEGRPLMLVHGGGGTWSHWIRNILPLARHYRVIAPDLPGFGDSQMTSLPDNPSEVAEIVAAGLREILAAGEVVDIAAFSFGGVGSGHLATQHPELVASLNLVGAVGLGVTRHPAPKMVRVSAATPIEDRWSAQIVNLKTLMLADEGNIDALAIYLQDHNTARTRLRSRPMSRAESLGPLLHELSCPVSAVWGRQDAVYPDDVSERIRLFNSLKPPAPVAFIEPGGHWVQYERAEAFNAYLLEMLAQRHQTREEAIRS